MRTSRLWVLAVVVYLTACASTRDRTPVTQPLLASGHGIDHVTILTNDLTAATNAYAKRLGFTVGPIVTFSFGFDGANIYFADGTYIELYAVHDKATVAATSEAFALEAPEGVTWMTLHSGSTADSAALLRQRGIPAWGPFAFPEDAKPGEWRFRLAGPEQPVLPGGHVYFVEYNEELRARRRAEDAENVRARETHANGARGLASVWVTVRDLSAAGARYESAGLVAGPVLRLDILDTTAREIRTPGGTILLVQSRTAAAGDTFSGISIRTDSVDRVRALLRESHALDLQPYRGLYGRSVLVRASVAHGASIEFFEER